MKLSESLAINSNDVKKAMMLKEEKSIRYWLKEIVKRVKSGRLNNNKQELIYWMVGITDGWILF